MIFQKFRTFKIPVQETEFSFKRWSFNTKFLIFKNSPFEKKYILLKKVYTFEKVDFFNKIRFVNINICVSPILYGTFDIFTPLNFKNL